jgi:hypothetical protein
MKRYELPGFLSDVRIEEGETPRRLKDVAASGVLWQAGAARFLIDVPGTARYLVADGQTIVIQRAAGGLRESVARFLRMSPLAALLYQRGVFACHAAAIATRQGAVLIAGVSGAGKSTLAARLVQRGCPLLADDVAAVELTNKDGLVVDASDAAPVLWPDAVQKLCPDGRPHWAAAAGGVPLCGIVQLSSHTQRADSDAQLSRFEAVTRMPWNSRIADALFDRARHLQLTAEIARRIPVRNMVRSQIRWDVDENADRILEAWG